MQPEEHVDKRKCLRCGRIFLFRAALRAPSPFRGNEQIFGCPVCESVQGAIPLCEEKGCEKEATTSFWLGLVKREVCAEHDPYQREGKL